MGRLELDGPHRSRPSRNAKMVALVIVVSAVLAYALASWLVIR